jgi:uncharacterized repeat protein (TIGR01451 family)
MWIGAAQAVHNNGMFELEGNTAHDSATTPPFDWESLFGASGNQLITPDPINGPLLADTFVSDTALPDQSYFTSNKDIQPIASGVQHWGCDPINNPLDKDNLLNAYAAAVQVPANAPNNAGDQVLYLASERGSNNGTSFAGFWLLKDKNVGCSGSSGFSGQHTDGDLLIISDYTNGGGTQDVSVYRWTGDDATGAPVLDASFNGSLCTAAPSNDNACAIANDSTITTPWSPTSHDSNTFVEAGIDLTTLLGSNGGCFTTFLAETRSSNQLTATLKDFAGGQFNTCVPPIMDTTAAPGGSSNPLGVANQHDVATISPVGDRPDPTGTISFFLCNPSEVTSGGCVSGGTQVGGAVTIAAGSATSANASGSLTATVGKYCWRAEYTPDADGSNFYVAASHTNNDTECFTVIKASPSISTTPSETSGSVGDLLNDSASLTGGSNFDGTGTITFNLYGPSDPNCDGTPAYTETVTADHNSPPDYATSNSTVTADTAGTWNWTADFSGDGNNNPASSGCGEESVVINGASIHILKTPDATQVNAGDQIGFTLTVWNDGAGDAKGVTLTDVLPTNPGLSWSVDATGAGFGSSCSIAAGVLSCGPVTVPAGTTQAASTFTVHITSGTTGATGGDCPGTGVVDNSGSVTTTNDGTDESSASTCVQAMVDLSVTKSGSPADQELGAGNITWTIVVTNNGPSADTGVVVSDPMPASNTFVSATTTKGSCTGGAILNCTIGPMAAGESVTITLVTTPSTVGTQTNTVNVVGNRPETNTGNNTATASVLTHQITPPPVKPCVAVSKVTPKQLFVGRKTTLTIHVTQGGKAVKGIHVRIKGAKINVRTKASNSKGVIKHNLKMKKAGILIFTPIASKACNTKRVGVTNVFTPPVTG